jgi:uncharacterized protein
MDPSPIATANLQLIQSYDAGSFLIAGVRHQGSVLLLPEQTLAWPVSTPEQVTAESLEPIRAAAPAVEILVLGCGPRFVLIPAELRAALKANGIVVEAMDTRAACRTYNLLLTENRRVAAALLAL